MSIKKTATKVTVKKLSKPIVKKIAPKKVAKPTKITWIDAQIREGYKNMKIQYRLPEQDRVSFYASKYQELVDAVSILPKDKTSLAMSSNKYAACQICKTKTGITANIGGKNFILETEHEL